MKFYANIFFPFLFFLVCFLANGQTATQPSGSGTTTDPYLISNLNELYWVSEQTFSTLNWSNGKYFLQTENIDATNTTTWTNGWVPIGGRETATTSTESGNKSFKGIYNGNNHEISNLYINSSLGLTGIFGKIERSGLIINVKIKNISLTNSASKNGSLVGHLSKGNVYNCSASGTLTSTGAIGGLIGQNNGGTVQTSFSTARVTSTSGDVSGGLVGLNQGTIKNSYSNGTVVGMKMVGGLVGANNSKVLFNNYSNSYVYKYSDSASELGGHTGRLYTTRECLGYWNSSKFSDGIGYIRTGTFGATALSESQMKIQSNFDGWDFEGETTNGRYNLWKMGSDGYPTVYDNGNIWTGAIDDDWNNTSNWSGGDVPNSNSLKSNNIVYIPSGLSNYPLLTENESAFIVKIENGARIDYNDKTINYSFLIDETEPIEISNATVTTSEDTPFTFTLTGIGVASETTLVNAPTKGTVSLSNNIATYTPTLNENGTDTFTYKLYNSNTATASITISSVNDAPTDLALSATAIDENSASGSTVGSLSSTDADSGDTHSYTLTDTTNYPDNSSFAVSGTNLITTEVFDYETKTTYNILLQTADAAGDTYIKTFSISVNDINEAPTDLYLSNNTVIESLSSGSLIGTLTSTDVDSGDSHTYSLVAGTGDTDNSYFSISAGNLLSNTSFDYSVKNTYSIRIATTDSGSASYSKTFTINISPTNSAPTNISLSTNSIAENQASGSTIGALTTTDTDSGDTHSYTLTDTTNYPDNSSFAISGTNLITTAVFDYETKISYTILVETSDGTATYTKTFTISITDVNEDSDGDGINNSVDNCPSVANASQTDADGDGIGDVCDNAPNVANPSQTDTDGDGTGDAADTDDDNDGVPDSEDAFPLDASENTDTDGDGTGDNADLDDDADGVPDTTDNAPLTPNIDQLDTDSDGIGDIVDPDDDNDGYSDANEITCKSDPLFAASLPADTDSDGIPDCLDTDDDNDGFSDTDETTCGTNPLDATSTPTDTDSDGTPDCIDTDDDNDGFEDENDAFPLDATEWLDTDQDGIGNNADPDDDNDGQTDEHETACGSDPLDANETSADADADGLPNCVDTDDDNDGVNDSSDAFPLDPSEWTDTDADGIGNNADEDDDNDGYSDFDELACGSDPLDRFKKPADQDQDGLADCVDSDRDGDGVENTQDVFPDDDSEWQDTDGDGLGDNFEVDDDNDGVLDSQDAFPLDPAEWADADGDGIGDNADPDDNNDGFEDEILFPSGVLTPNSSGLESTWKIINIEKHPNARVRVYDKYGVEVLNQAAYKNDWNGTYKDSNTRLPAGSYYYLVDLKNGEKPKEGWLYLTY